MSTSKPTLGYPSRTAAVIGMLAEGFQEHDIARKIGISVSTVSALRCSAERGWPRKPLDRMRTVNFPVSLLQKLAGAARRRGLSREMLAFMIVEQVVDDNLVDAVLDDGAARHG